MNYENLCIYELRKLAREIGVKSPTSLKRAELIEKINAIETGKELPCIMQTRRGRPIKQINFTYDISEKGFKSDYVNFLLDLKEKNLQINKQIDEILSELIE